MKKPGIFAVTTFLTAVLAVPPVASAQTLDELARIVREAAQSETRINQQREASFVKERDEQQNLLARARQELATENTRSDRLRDEYDRNERSLAELETTLAERMGNLGELFGVVRQASGDVQAALDDSMVTAQMPGRTQFLSDLAQRKSSGWACSTRCQMGSSSIGIPARAA
jgi:biopolymer transport protein ExbB